MDAITILCCKTDITIAEISDVTGTTVRLVETKWFRVLLKTIRIKHKVDLCVVLRIMHCKWDRTQSQAELMYFWKNHMLLNVTSVEVVSWLYLATQHAMRTVITTYARSAQLVRHVIYSKWCRAKATAKNATSTIQTASNNSDAPSVTTTSACNVSHRWKCHHQRFLDDLVS